MSSPKKRILFVHPDLGIGGAERLVVDAAVGLQERGHSVTVYTSHCDPQHCFDEARDGTLAVRVAGNTIVPPSILGRFSILCAILRQLHLTLSLVWSGELADYDCLFLDQLSACLPLFRLFAPQVAVLFYCHFPDYLLAPRQSLVRSLYRIPFDWLEACTTGLADTIAVNSRFTRSVFATAFPRIHRQPRVVYPCVDISEQEAVQSPRKKEGEGLVVDGDHEPELLASDSRKVLLSINRFERKKNIELAVRAFAQLSPHEKTASRLVVAGGYDPRVAENISYHNELGALCDSLGLKHITCKNLITSLSIPRDTDVLFLLSITARWKTCLLKAASLLLYTPENEHFGIVPLEALAAELPVLAANSGGPLETIDDGVTGWLRPDVPREWAAVVRLVLFQLEPAELREMGRKGRERVATEFSRQRMAERLESEFCRIPARSKGVRAGWPPAIIILLLVGALAVLALGIGIGLRRIDW